MKYLLLFSESKQSDDFERLIKDVLVDLTDQRFYYTLINKGTSYELKILHKGEKKRIVPRYEWDSDESIDDTFEWGVVRETLQTMVEYLPDIYPKIRFTEFKAEGKHLAKSKVYSVGSRYKRTCISHRSVESGLIRYTFDDFSKNLSDSDRLSEVLIKFILRFRGKIKPS